MCDFAEKSIIAIGCIVRNRAWILPEYLDAISKIEYPNKRFLFLENDSQDNTAELLKEFCNAGNAVIKQMSFSGNMDWHRKHYWKDSFDRMSKIRNEFLNMFLETDAEYLLSIDSDIIIKPDLLDRLLSHADQNTIVGAVISNIPNKPVDGRVACNFMCLDHNGVFAHPKEYPVSGIMDVDVIGAVYLIPRKAIVEGVRYQANAHGEDIGFCINAKKKGYKMKILFDAVCDHRMIDKSIV